jgi:hypothetical protein
MSKKRDETVLICMPAPKVGEPLILADNVLDVCGCGASVQRRPHTPTGARIVCVGCLEKRGVQPGDELVITPRSVIELATYFGARKPPGGAH